MSTDTIIRELFRNLEAAIHERLRVIEDVIRLQQKGPEERKSNVIDNLSYRVSMLEAAREGADPPVRVHRVDRVEETPVAEEETPSKPSVTKPSVARSADNDGLFINAMKDLEITLKTMSVAPAASDDKALDDKAENEIVEEEVDPDTDAVADEDAVDDNVQAVAVDEAEAAEEETAEEAAEEAADENEAEEEEAEEEEGIELEEFTFKSRTFYKDGENLVYTLDADGNPVHVGRWDPVRERVLFKPS